MPHPATRLNGMRQSIIREMTRLAHQYDAINLAQGFPDFGTAPEIIAAAHSALDDDVNQYSITWGSAELRRQIAETMQRLYDLPYDPETDVCVTCGVTEGIMAAVLACANPGDEVVIIDPCHENYIPAVAFAQATPVFVPLEPPDYHLDADRLRRAFSNKTAALILNSPHNPTGRVFTRQELEAVAQLCREFDVVAITDEIYDRILYDDHVHVPLASLDGMFARTITVNGLGKTFAVTGWRLGYACTPEPLAGALRTVHDFLTICAPAPLQRAAVTALGLPETFYARQQADYTRRRSAMLAILQEAGFCTTLPEGAYYILSDFGRSGFAGGDFAFAHYMTSEIGVAVVPGSSFYHVSGLGTELVRWAFPKKQATLDAVADRLRRLEA